jgi:hypothetical protein
VIRIPIGIIALAFSSAAAFPQLPPIATQREFQVNTFTPNVQAEPAIAMAADGSWVVVWRSFGAAEVPFRPYIQAQRFTPAGRRIGEELRIDQGGLCLWTGPANCLRRSPAVASDGAGKFVVAWSSASDSFVGAIRARRFDATGVALGPEFVVSPDQGYSTAPSDEPAVVADGAGGFVVAWVQSPLLNEPTELFARRYDEAGNPLGPAFQVNSFTAGRPSRPQIAHLPGGDFAVVWQSTASSGTDSSERSIQARLLDGSGTPLGPDFQVNQYTTGMQFRPAVGADGSSNFVVAWESWGSAGTDGSLSSVQARLYDAAGQPRGPQFQVNEVTEGPQSLPSVAVRPDGSFLVAWLSGKRVAARQFDATGVPVSPESPVIDSEPPLPLRPAVVAAASGPFVVAWSGYEGVGDDDGERVMARRIHLLPSLFADGFESADSSRWSREVH